MERTIATLGKTNQRKLREFKNVRSITELRRLYPQSRSNEQAYQLASQEYNLNILARNEERTRIIANARRNISNQLLRLSKNPNIRVAIDITRLHQGYSLKKLLNDLMQRIDRYLPNNKLYLEVNNIKYSLGNANKMRLNELVSNNLVRTELTTDSDVGITYAINEADTIYISILNDANTYQNNNGGFFPYYNKTDYNLTRYGIYTCEGQYKTFNKDVCIIQALRMGGLDETKVEQMKTIVRNSHIPMSKLSDICEMLRIQIQLKTKIGEKSTCYGKEHTEIYKIGLLESHYFILDTTENTSYSIENYESIKNEPKHNLIYKKRNNSYRRDSSKFIDSFTAIHLLIENKHTLLEKIPYDHLTRTQYHKKFDEEIKTLEYDDSNVKAIEYEEPKNKEVKTNVFFDFETRTDDDKKHIPYLCCFIMDDGRKGSFIGEDCGLQMLKCLYSMKLANIQLIAHNATYDYTFLVKHLEMKNEINRGSRIITAEGSFNKMAVTIKDSYHLIALPLKKFSKMFNLEQAKEIIPYELYNNTTYFNKRYVRVDDANVYLSSEEVSQFIDNIKTWGLLSDNETYDIIEYSRIYCEMDCIVLRDGYNIFRQWILSLELPSGENAKLDINNILTCAGLAHTYMLKSGCYNGVYELSSVPQRFIQKTVVGGRTMCANNKKREINTGKRISDFDGVSLYPSAMKRMSGFLKGKPKVLYTTDYDVIKSYDGYFIEIEITNVPIKRNFPLLSEKNNEGIRIFSNKIEQTIYVDKIQMEDLIQFHGLTKNDFKVIRGYYFNDGFNSHINIAINYLFETRLQKKREKNPSETIYKLIMNSAYGKTIMKEILTETRIFNHKDRFDVFVSKNYDFIESVQQVDGCEKYKVKSVKTINEHSNIAQVGSSVLSWSKRIMNEVMCLAEDIGVEIFYQDTDSMHMYDEDIKRLSDAFTLKYSRNLIGEDLGQFHTDFSMSGKYSDIHSRRMIMLGKKSYIDELIGKDKDGNEHIEYHIRMKGIPNSCVEYTVEKMGLENPYILYEKLLKGEKILFDLTQGQQKAMFKYVGNYSVKTLTVFDRIVKF